jgi:nucleoid DNA-binding protein
MQHRQVLKKLAKLTGYTPTELNTIMLGVADILIEAVSSGRSVRITHVGLFENARKGFTNARHPVTGDRIIIPPRRRLKFMPSMRLRKAVEKSNKILKQPSYEERFLKEDDDGEVRSSDRPGEDRKGKGSG